LKTFGIAEPTPTPNNKKLLQRWLDDHSAKVCIKRVVNDESEIPARNLRARIPPKPKEKKSPLLITRKNPKAKEVKKIKSKILSNNSTNSKKRKAPTSENIGEPQDETTEENEEETRLAKRETMDPEPTSSLPLWYD